MESTVFTLLPLTSSWLPSFPHCPQDQSACPWDKALPSPGPLPLSALAQRPVHLLPYCLLLLFGVRKNLTFLLYQSYETLNILEKLQLQSPWIF